MNKKLYIFLDQKFLLFLFYISSYQVIFIFCAKMSLIQNLIRIELAKLNDPAAQENCLILQLAKRQAETLRSAMLTKSVQSSD